MLHVFFGSALGISVIIASVLTFAPQGSGSWQCADGVHGVRVTANIPFDHSQHMDQALMMERLTLALFPESKGHVQDISGWWGGAIRRISDGVEPIGFVKLQTHMDNLESVAHVEALQCGTQDAVGPEKAYELVLAAKSVLGSQGVKWTAKAIPEPSNGHLKQYFSMMSDMNQDKELVARHKSEFSAAAIWHIAKATKLVLNGVVMSDTSDEHIYHELIVHPALLACKNPRNVLIIGGAEGAVLREVLRDTRVEKATMVEIDEGLVDVCRTSLFSMHQGSFHDERAELLFQDGIEFMQHGNDASFDVVIVDGIDFSHGDIADYGNVLYSSDFYRQIHRVLRPGGVLAQYMSDVDRSKELKTGGFGESIGFGVDIASFFGAGARFTLAVKDESEPLSGLISKRLAEGQLNNKTRYLSAESLKQSLGHTGRRLKGGPSGGPGGGCSGTSGCNNIVALDGDRPELTMNVEPGDMHTDENGFCSSGFTGPDDHCDAPCEGHTNYTCKCVSQDLAIAKNEEQGRPMLIAGYIFIGLSFLLLIAGVILKLRYKGFFDGETGAMILMVMIATWAMFCGVGVYLLLSMKDANRFFNGCSAEHARAGAGSTHLSILVVLVIAAAQIWPSSGSHTASD